MGKFTRSWQRKTGCVTLSLSLMFTMCFLRSITIRDQFIVATPHGETFVAISSSGHFSFAILRARVFDSETWKTTKMDAKWGCAKDEEFDGIAWPSVFHLMMGLPRNGVSLLESRFSIYREARDSKWMVGCLIPYWSVILPLALFSAGLLFNEPHKVTQKKIRELTPAVGT